MQKLGQCQIEGCSLPARYALYKLFPNGEKRWLHTCYLHEIEIGRKNMCRAGGRYEKEGLQHEQSNKG